MIIKNINISILAVIFISILILFLAFVSMLGKNIFYGEGQSLEESMEWQSEHYDTSFYNGLQKEEFTVKSYDSYVLHGEILKNPSPSSKYVIISHGHYDTRYGSLKYASIYLSLGYNCIIYDLRGHGANRRTFCSYSVREGKDLAEIVHFFQAKLGRNAEIGLHGESLGAATTIASLKDVQNVSFAVADCGFSDIENVLEVIWRYSHIPTAIGPVMNQYAKLRFDIPISAMRPIDSLAKNQVPILFIHGEADQYILPANSERMYEATKGKRDLLLVPKAGHAESVFVNKSLYTEKLKDFLSSLAS